MTQLLLALLLATSPHADNVARARQYIDAHRAELGLDAKNDVRPMTITPSDTVSFEQYYGGVKVRYCWLHVRFDNGAISIDDRRATKLDLDTHPKIRYQYAKELAERKLPQITAGDPELLIISPQAFSGGDLTDRNRLTWLVPMKSGPFQWEVYVDAQSGEVYQVVQTQMCGGPPPLPKSHD